jgi:Fe2+ transport system protein FeoA
VTQEDGLTLSQLPAGLAARVVRVLPGPRQVRLASLGLVVGARVELAQRSPAIVARVGATTLALEAAIGEEILVQLEDRS